MSYYFVAQIRIKDEMEYQKYIGKSGSIFKKYKGEYLAVDDAPQILEGTYDYSRLVLIKFSSKMDFNAWYNSGEYQEILQYRLKASECISLLVKGLDEN